MKQIKDLFVMGEEYTVFITTLNISGAWATGDNTVAVDWRLKKDYYNKHLAPQYQSMEIPDINIMIEKYLSSKEYELDRLWETTQIDYNPINNYDMTETGSESASASGSGDSKDLTTTYDSSAFKDNSKNESSSQSSSEAEHTLKRSGNIGVTTTQQMLQSQRELVHFDFIGYVAEMINNEFCTSSWNQEESEREIYGRYPL